jgi:DNA-binding transcriptional MerR regulator
MATIFNRMIFREVLKDLGVTKAQVRQLLEQKGVSADELKEFMGEAAADQLQPREEIEIKIEQHQGQLYAFRVDNDQFLGQGTDRDSLVARIAETYKNTKFTVTKDQGADLLKKAN